MNQFTQAANCFVRACIWVQLCAPSTSSSIDFSNLYFWPLTYGAAVPLSRRLACFHGRAKHILYILDIRDFPPQLSSKPADWPWNVGTLMISLIRESVLLLCRQNATLSSSSLKVLYSDFTFMLISQQLLRFCRCPQSVSWDHGAVVNIEWDDGRCPGYFYTALSLLCHPSHPRAYQLWILTYVTNHLKSRLTAYYGLGWSLVHTRGSSCGWLKA